MRVLLILALLAPTVASSQSGRLTPGERLLVGTIGATTVVAVLVVSDGEAPVLALASPLTAGFAVYGTGRALGNGGGLGPTLVWAGLGALPGLALFAVAEVVQDGSRSSEFGGPLVAVSGADVVRLLGLAAYVLVPPFAAVAGFERSQTTIRPTLLRGPDSGRAAGLALRVGL